ncbi:MAG: AMIN domain-containing protein [Archangiaceae bacterium]|nr:AMIN domain-containing protein [Archangiaceae bacterium]
MTTIDGEPRAWRTLAANLSRDGVFVRMPQPLEPGTRVAISLEANGQALPLAQGEVRWARKNESGFEGRFQGCGVRFTDYLHPRASELVNYLVETLDTGKPLKAAPAPKRRWWPYVAGVGVLAAAAALVIVAFQPPEPKPLPTPVAGAGALEVLSVAPRVNDELAAMVSPAEEDEAPAGDGTGSPESLETNSAVPEVAPPPIAAMAAETADEPTDAPTATGVTGAPTAAATPTAAEALSAAGTPIAAATPTVETPAAATPTVETPTAATPTAPAARTRRSTTANAEGQLQLPSGAAASVSWSPSPDGLDVRPQLRGEARISRVFALSDPPRLVFDIEGGAPSHSHTIATDSSLITRVRLGKQGTRTRVVVDLASEPHRVMPATDHAVLQF